jgi:hypothetical protein
MRMNVDPLIPSITVVKWLLIPGSFGDKNCLLPELDFSWKYRYILSATVVALFGRGQPLQSCIDTCDDNDRPYGVRDG